MLSIITVCGNGIGSSLMLKMKVEEICDEHGIAVSVESSDFNAAKSKTCDLIITIKELASQFEDRRVAVVRSYVNKKKIEEDVLEIIKQLAAAK
ncbi:PTS sugar transporter subunit IIB [Brevibacillus massiliensis]|uniref:PTS sugar transporter subunit IIB n=1 Tax=Brevibacillus massiliensis TaxID=1118054 RepID=UPI00031EF42B|nr:PTS sugar transporter subunit IIB [Brevibacillus massiliensis]